MTNDIVELLYGIKENIKIVEEITEHPDGDDGQLFELLYDIETSFIEMSELIKLFMISERDSYYGYFLMNMTFQAEFTSNTIAGIKLNTFPPVFAANPLLLCKYTLKEIIYIFCHEVDHILLNHPTEMVKANPNEDPLVFKEFNLAADASVNDRINHEIRAEKRKFMTTPPNLITSKALKQMFQIQLPVRQMENYEYYLRMIQSSKVDAEDIQMVYGDTSMESDSDAGETSEGQSGSSDGQEGNDNQQGDAAADKDESENNQSTDSDSNDDGEESDDSEGNSGGNGNDNKYGIKTAKNCTPSNGHNWDAGDSPEDAQEAVKEFVNQAHSMMNEETRGLMPAFFQECIKAINKPPVISWQKLLKKYIGTISADKTKTRMKLNRRQPKRFDLSGSKENKVLKIVIAIDTSGSVNDKMIAEIINEIFAIIAKRKHEVTVIECDAQVQKVYRIKSPTDIQKKVNGRGGTMFTPVIEYINNNRYFRDALMIYFTDGFGERSIPKPMTYRNLWVIHGKKDYLSLSEPYGTVISMTEGDK